MSSPTIQQVPLDPRYSVNPNDNTSSVNMSSTESDTPKIENSAAIPVADTGSKNSDEPSPVVKLPSKPRASENLSNAFSRRTSVPNANATSSVYSEESEEKPAWMKDSSTNKYDKYGARPVHVPNARGKRDSRDTSDRYSKYDIGSSDNRLKLREGEAGRGYEDSEESHRNSKRTYEQDPPSSAPYNNLIAANPASFQENQQIKRYQTFQSHINNRSAKDQNSIVRTHYNQRAHQSKTQGARTDSPIIKLRNFNNAIKYILLGNFALTKKKEPSARDTVILDLCCGKGGDLNKCEFIGVDQYVGIDISDASVKEAFSRYYRSKAKFVPRHAHENRDTRKLHFEACFATGDCFAYSVPDILEPSFPGIIDKVFPADCVSIQFALHYAFETEEKVDKLLTNVTKSLRSGGTFIGTIPSSDFIRKKIVNHEFVPTEDNKVRFGNDLYSVTFQKEPPSDGVFRPPFGNKYMFSLKDAIDDVPEYVVPFETLRAKCEEFGLVLKYKKNFIDIFNEEIPKYFSKLNKKLIDGMKRSDGKYGVEGSEKEATAFYLGFVFEKL